MHPWRWAIFSALAAVPIAVMVATADAQVAPPPDNPASVIQDRINAAQAGDEIVIPPGRWVGHLLVDKAVTIDGQGKATIDGGGEGTVILVKTNGATLKGLRVVGSGALHDRDDSGIRIEGNGNVIKDNVLDDTLFGIDLHQSNHTSIRRNRITSKPFELGVRGDAIRLWYSHDNIIADNVIKDSRDFVLWYSKRNHVFGNESSGSRYGMHFMFAADNIIENNRFWGNSVGMSMMYDEGDVIRGNIVSHATGATGMCLSFKEASNITVENNELIYCANGVFLDISPFQPDTVNTFTGNRIAFTDIAISFLNDWKGNIFKSNTIESNMTEVAVFGGGSAKRNEWDGNTWDSYEGFDRDGDGVGDTPHRVLGYAGRIWMDVPNTRFFKGTAVLEVIDFLDRLAPFSEPELLMEDRHPKMNNKPETKS